MAAYTEWGVGNNPEPFWVVLHHLGPTFINGYTCIVNVLQTWLIETEGNMGVMISFSQGGMHPQSVSCRRDGRLMFYKAFLYYFGFFRYCLKHSLLWYCDWVKLSKRISLFKPSYMCSCDGAHLLKNFIFKPFFKFNKDTIWCTKI